jgi:hypothetical protein
MLLESLLACTPLDDAASTDEMVPHPVLQEALDLIAGVAQDM